jgi:uroporphyrinogen decarboxylase
MNDRFLRACRGQAVDRTPLWIMRQAGRYLPEYRELRERHGFAALYREPELAARVTLQPLDRFDLDAAILFSDILVPAEAMGFRVRFDPGPVLDAPVRSAADVDRIGDVDVEAEVPYVFDAIRLLRRELATRVPLIGFAASPFTLAVYLVEGGGSRRFEHVKALLFGEPETAHRLLDRLTEVTARYLEAQIRAGAQAVQLFDSWGGILGRNEYRELALPYARRVLERISGLGAPRIFFALDLAHALTDVGESGADVIGVDWRLPLDEAAQRLGRPHVLQGNLDPCVLYAPPERIREHVGRVLDSARALPGHVFNLGHGIHPDTPVASVEVLVEAVASASRR